MITEDKINVRKSIQEIKKQYSFLQKKDRSISILNKVEHNINFQNAKIILVYWSMEDEVSTHDFILKWYQKKKIILPSVQKDRLILKEFTGLDSMKKGKAFEILEPIGKEFLAYDQIELAIVPGLAFDKQLNRLGRGKAYYDKLLVDLTAYKIGVCFDFQMFKMVPTDEHDVKMDLVITN